MQAGLVTASTDGRVNFWSLSNLREPVESMQVGDSVSSFAVAPESDALLLGDDHGSIYSVPVSSQSGSQRRRQAKKFDSADAEGENFGHFGMVTSISTKTLKKGANSRAAGLSKGFLRGSGGLFLSSGVDWTVKLWSPAYGEKPLISLVSHSYDYMSDVRWNPVHPSLFATASSNGTIGLWNLASSLDEPLTGQDGILLDPAASPARPLNKIRWSADGRRLAVASQDQVHVLSLSETVLRIKGDEDHKVMNQLWTRGLIERQ
jgi:dynein intermediate chain